jgi:hypothetical protein
VCDTAITFLATIIGLSVDVQTTRARTATTRPRSTSPPWRFNIEDQDTGDLDP